MAELMKEKLQDLQQQKQDPTPAPASETTPRSRALTSYNVLVLNDETGEWAFAHGQVEARTPEAAVEACINKLDGVSQVVAVPSSVWHEFERTTTFKKV